MKIGVEADIYKVDEKKSIMIAETVIKINMNALKN